MRLPDIVLLSALTSTYLSFRYKLAGRPESIKFFYTNKSNRYILKSQVEILVFLFSPTHVIVLHHLQISLQARLQVKDI